MFGNNDYPEESLSSVCVLKTGNSIPEAVKRIKYLDKDYPLPYIGTKDVSFSHTINYENGVSIPIHEPNFVTAPPYSVLLCIEGGSAGRKIAITDREVCFGNKLCMFHSKIISSRYLFYVLQSSPFRKLFVENMTGLIGGVSVKTLGKLKVKIPPLNIQKSIVDKLDSIFPLLEL